MVVRRDGKFYVMSADGTKKLGGPYANEHEARLRLQQIEAFTHAKDGK